MRARVRVQVVLPVADVKPSLWPVAGTRWAGFQPGGTSEAVVAGRQVSRVLAVFRLWRCPLSAQISGAAQMIAQGQRWHVTAVNPCGGARAGFLDVHVVSNGEI